MVKLTPKDTELHERWHHTLHPSVHTQTSGNALPKHIASFIHPTHAVLQHVEHNIRLAWRSRNHRKNRYLRMTPRSARPRHAPMVWHGLVHMLRVEYWNISWWVAICYTTGSVVWVVNGFVVFLPLVSQMTESTTAAGWTAFLGASIFELGSVLGVLEAWNRDDTAHFGWSTEKLPSEDKESNGLEEFSERGNRPLNGATHPKPPRKHWKWFSSQGKYWHELGFLAAVAQLVAATIFWISGFTAIPQIYDSIEENKGLLDGVYWTPQVVGGSGFIISSTLLILETQRSWYTPSPLNLGWQVGFWNFIGSVGFTLCGALGYAASASSGAMYQSNLSTFWGGWAFLVGSVLQWYESVNSVS